MTPSFVERAFRRVLVFVVVIIVIGGLLPQFAQAQESVPAQRADAFVETVGVNGGLTHGVSGDEYETIKEAFQELGVRHTRQTADISAEFTPDRLDRLVEAHEETGVKYNLLTSYTAAYASPPEIIALIKELGTDAVSSVEGPNEPELFDGSNPDWAEDTYEYQCAIYEALNNDPETEDIPVIGPSVASPSAAEELGNISACVDFGNLHQYFSGRHPETNGWGPNGYGSIDWNRDYIVSEMTPGVPYHVTETGWRIDPDAPQGRGATTSERTATRYLPRLYLEYFRRADAPAARIFKFKVLPHDGWGLLREDYSRRPSFHALKNLISILEDPGSSFNPDDLSLEVDATEEIRRVLLQKSNGDYYLALWRPVASEKPNDHDLIDVSPVPVTLQVAPGLEEADRWELQDDGSFAFDEDVDFSSGGTLGLQVSDQVTLVRLVPGEDGGSGGSDLVPQAGQTISLKAEVNGKYVSASSENNPLIADGSEASIQSRYQVSSGGAEGVVCLRSVQTDRFVAAESAGEAPLVADREVCSDWEKFAFVEAGGGGKVGLKAQVNGQFVTAEDAGTSPLIADRDKLLGWETFQWEVVEGTVANSSLKRAPEAPQEFALKGNAPNPFRGATTVHYTLADAAQVTLTVYDALGRKVRTLVSGRRQATGYHTARFEAQGLSSGVYLTRLVVRSAGGTVTKTRKLTLVR